MTFMNMLHCFVAGVLWVIIDFCLLLRVLVMSLSTIVGCEVFACSAVHVCCRGKVLWLLTLEGGGW